MNLHCVIVTHNSAAKIVDLVDSLCKQSIKPTSIIVVDNASKDNTVEVLEKSLSCNCILNIISLKTNTGGAGGFRKGLEIAIEESADFIITFDDDVIIKDSNYIECMLSFLNNNELDIASPLVVDMLDHSYTSYNYKLGNEVSNNYQQIVNSKAEINDVKFFNGCIFKSHVLIKLKGPKSKFFIRGDEQEFRYRVLNQGYGLGTSKEIKVYHPSAIDELKVCDGYSIVDIEHLGKMYFSTRNQNYLYSRSIGHKHSSIKRNRILLKSIYKYFKYYLFHKKDLVSFYIWIRAFIDGVLGRFDTNYSEFIKKKYFN